MKTPAQSKTSAKVRSAIQFVSLDGRSAGAEIDAFVQEIIGRVAHKWTMLILEVLAQNGTLRFTQIANLLGSVSQKMLTKTLRQMEADGFVTRTVHPVIPPRVDYALTQLGLSLCAAFCGVWIWAEEHHVQFKAAQSAYRERDLARKT